MKMRSVFRSLSGLLPVLFLALVTAAAQDRDHLTAQEVELIREAQELDKRIDVFIKAIDRRMLGLNGVTQSNAKQLKKDAEKWGELPSGSRTDLIKDIARILDEAITNIDDVSEHDAKNPLIAKALRKLAAEVVKVVEQLKPLREQAKTDSEVASFELLAENADSIIAAANKLPPPADKKSEKSKNKPVN